MDRLIDAVKKKANPSVIGLDPTIEMMPEFLKKKYFGECGRTPEAAGRMFVEFNRSIIDAVKDIAPAVKPQIAMYERFGEAGIRAYNETCRYARGQGLIVIGDIKRGDISSTAAAYAAHIGNVDIQGAQSETWYEDAVTLNPYMGSDGIKPFLEICRSSDKGLFILVKTSNPSSSEMQDLVLADGRTVYEACGKLVSDWGAELIGKYGYSKVGAVVGATHRAQGAKLRKSLPHTFFLVPGYGAQGASADDIAGFFDENGLGAVVNSSRGITSSYKKSDDFREEQYAEAAQAAAVKMCEDLQRVL
ncbi:MAG: orotidine-5'-phosphate decarboxylase [Firmicutes bacterium]|nr:orotidine-5'-phosphate decarboxylase [Bacillota bacterium]